MTDSAAHLAKASSSLASGRYLLAGDFAEQAGRDAYMAAYHAAQAFTIARTGKEPKTHSGARSEFSRLARVEPGIAPELVSFLGRAYELKTVADYEASAPVTIAEAQASLDLAARFVATITALI